MRTLVLVTLIGCSQPQTAARDASAITNDAAPDAAAGDSAPMMSGDLLRFVVFGDARPTLPDDAAGYPSATVKAIFDAAAMQGAQFVVGTGDYMMAITQAGADAQVQALKSAAAAFHEPIYLAMGNHECQTRDKSNCPKGDESPNMKAFVKGLLPAGVTTPWYRIDVATPHGRAKLIFVAPNAWSPAQAAWLAQQAADPTAYTFIVRHQPSDDTDAPGVVESDQILAGKPLTVGFYGHHHYYERTDVQHVVVGNGGAALTRASFYGYLFVEQRFDGTLTLTAFEVPMGMARDTWRVTAAGKPAP